MCDSEIKLVLVGQTAVGKTCLVEQATLGTFSEDSVSTLGASYTNKVVNVNDKEVRIQIWDTAGQEKYRGMTPMYYRGAQVALVVYSVTDRQSFLQLDEWISSIHDNADDNILLILVANKCDLESERVVSTEEGQKKAESINANFIEVSAKTAMNVDELFMLVPKITLENQNTNTKIQGKAVQPVPASKKQCNC